MNRAAKIAQARMKADIVCAAYGLEGTATRIHRALDMYEGDAPRSLRRIACALAVLAELLAFLALQPILMAFRR